MTETIQLEEATHIHDAPQLLVEWTPRWQDFVTSIGPALARSAPHLAGEAPYGIFPYRGMVASWAVEAFLLFIAIVIPLKLAKLHPYVPPKLTHEEILYYSGDELPRTQDLGGSQAGTSGRAGGSEAHHPTQTIRIARGGSLTPQVVDAPDLKLPTSTNAVANLLAVRPDAGPPPLEGMRSTRTVSSLPVTVVAPAPTVAANYARGELTLGSVIPPAPSVSRDRPRATPSMNATVIAPAPEVSREQTVVAPALNPTIVAPAPAVSRDSARSAPTLAQGIIPPAPGSVSREISRSPVQMANPAIVPPPVSAPERDPFRTPKLTLPAPSVIAPPPSTDTTPDLRRLASGSVPDSARTVVPPPPTQTGNGSFMNNLIVKIFGPNDVVPPPPIVAPGTGTPGSRGTAAGSGSSLSPNVVPPPPSINAGSTSGNARGVRGGTSLNANVVPPPPSALGAGAVTGRSTNGGSSLGSANVVPPPPTLSNTGRGTGTATGNAGAPGGTLLADNVVPPPPSVGGGTVLSGSGRGAKGSGLGAPLDAGSVLAPPTGGGSGGKSGAIISTQPGSQVGSPINSNSGELAISPAGGDKPGVGGSGGGAGIGHGKDKDSGSGMNGSGPGASKSGTGRGSDPNAHGGISPTSGPGGAGTATSGTPPVPGVDISGGSTIVTLPSFGSDPAANDPSGAAARSSLKRQQQALGVTVISSSGGGFESYKKMLPGREKYTTYLDTSLGTMVMEFADAASAGHPYAGTIASPQAIRTDLPAGLTRGHLIVACILDASGNIKNARVLETGPPDMTAKVLSALPSWKFQPAMRGDQPVEVNAILGFGIDTNDRF